MPYSVRGRVWVGLTCALLGATCAGACGSSGGGALPGSGGGAGGSEDLADQQQVGCRTDKDCRSTGQLCGDDDVCVDCIIDSHCGIGEMCTPAGTCRRILNNNDGGAPSEGGTRNTGGSKTGGTSAGGTESGGASNGGTESGGSNSGGTQAGGSNNGGSNNGGQGGMPNNGNCQSEPIDPCVGIPHFTGTQTVDGDAADFCGIAPFALEMASSPFYRAPKAPLASTTHATFRVGWSATALHVFIQVFDASVHPNQSGSLANIWNGDNIEFYASPKAPAGLFNASRTYEYGAFQVIAAPPGLSAPAGSAAFTSTGVAYAVPSLDYKISSTATGYSVEAQIPWTTAAPSAGSKMGFDAGLSDDVDGLLNAKSEYRDYYSLLYNASYVGYCTTYYEPYCDSRNWCAPTALP